MRNHRGWTRTPVWWPKNEAWPPTPGAQAMAWSRFGRIMAAVAVMTFLSLVIAPLVVGVILAAVFGGWNSVIVAVVFWLGMVTILMLVLRFAMRGWRPVRGLITTAGRLAEGDYTARVRPTSAAPLDEVVRSFNRMAERLETGEEARQRLLADVGHELRTPLTIVRGEIEAMADGVHDLSEDRLRQLLGDLAVMERLLDDLRTLSTADAGRLRVHREPTDVSLLASEAVERFEADAIAVAVTLRLESTPGASVEAEVDPVRIREVLDNLLANALRATSSGGRVSVAVMPEAPHDPGSLALTVTDDGVGIQPEDLDQVFERFNKGTGSDGTGLGLTISRNLVEAHGGRIRLESEPGAGTTVTVELPYS